MNSRLQIGSLILVLGFAYATQATGQVSIPSLTAEQMREDFAYLRDTWAPLDKSFTGDKRRLFMSIVEEGIANVDTYNPSEFALEVSRAVAASGNGHTTVMPFTSFRYVPVRVWWFSDGLYIVESDPDDSEMLGARVEAIGKFTAEQALARLSPFISGTYEHQRFLSPSFITNLDALHHAGISDTPAEASFTLRMRGGETVVVRLGQEQSDGPRPGGVGILRPSPLNRPGRWSHVLDALPVGEEDCYLAAKAYAPDGISLEPDVEMSMTFEDYASGRDPVLATALRLAD